MIQQIEQAVGLLPSSLTAVRVSPITACLLATYGPLCAPPTIPAPGIIATPMIQQIEQAVGRTELFGEGDPGALGRKGSMKE
jgi:hypothetical protein